MKCTINGLIHDAETRFVFYLIHDGENNFWRQNGQVMDKAPDVQASAYAHSLIKRYNMISKNVVIDWALCFPDCDIPDNTQLPTNLAYDKIIDAKSALYLDKK